MNPRLANILNLPFVQVALPILIGFTTIGFWQNARLDEMSKRIDHRLASIDHHLDRIETKLDNHSE
jgi:hypothetical protein